MRGTRRHRRDGGRIPGRASRGAHPTEHDEASAAPAEAPTAPSLDDLIGSDGSEQATDAAVARDFPKLPILLMTGYADQRERVSGLEALICDVIAKPFALAEIKFAVDSALAKGKWRP